MATAVPNVKDLPVDQIDPSPDNPRLAFGGGLGDLTELTESIRAQGVLQHLVVCPGPGGRYQLVFGHRRLEAAKAAGLTEVPVEIRDYDDAARLAAMCGENEGREDLTPLQEAFAYKQALERKGPDGKKLFTQRTLAERLGVSQAKISKYTGIWAASWPGCGCHLRSVAASWGCCRRSSSTAAKPVSTGSCRRWRASTSSTPATASTWASC
jgi:ParB/RepB/Spo0J family partition protein